jgi:hypothetical protein
VIPQRLQRTRHRLAACALTLACSARESEPPKKTAAEAGPAPTACETGVLAVGVSCTQLKGAWSLRLLPGEYASVTMNVAGEVQTRYSGESAGYSSMSARATRTLAFFNSGTAETSVTLESGAGKFENVSILPVPFASTLSCEAACSELVQLPIPMQSDAYRILSPERYQFGRRELVQTLVASAREFHERAPNAGLIGFADLSQGDGEIPGTDVRAPRHPAPSHRAGFSVDIAYVVLDHMLRDEPACPSSDRQFCEGPHTLDVASTVTLMAPLARSGRAIQVIVDPKMSPDVNAHIQARLSAGDSDSAGLSRLSEVLTSGVPFHADHFHLSVSRACFDGIDNDGDGLKDLEDPQCVDPLDDDESR